MSLFDTIALGTFLYESSFWLDYAHEFVVHKYA